jgi:transketolase (EC 2.2.1.1)
MNIDELVINSIRFLSVDAVEKANSGHPGMPLGTAHIGYILFDRILRYNPENPKWVNRDRFVLSNGHGSMLLYSLLYLYGFDLTLEDIKNFRQLGSKTPGHPESFLTKGVEATTGPLGQGIANAVGMAIEQKHLGAICNKLDEPILDYKVFCMVGDGDLMEGISYEAAALAGHLNLDNLFIIWDNNHITIDGDTSLAWSEDVLRRFENVGFKVRHIEDGYDIGLLENTIKELLTNQTKPVFLSVRTHIGYKSIKQDSAEAHGAPLGKEAIAKLRESLNWPYEPFHIPQEVLDYTRRKVEEGRILEQKWQEKLLKYKETHKDIVDILTKNINLENVISHIPRFTEDMATRQASGKVLNAIAPHMPTLFGGSADLHESNNTYIHNEGDFEATNYYGRNIHFGIREHAMGAIANGMAYGGITTPYVATFLVFSDYMRPSIRVAALSKLHVIYIFTHDSIGVGEDGPTHQPVEHIPSLRLIPNLWVMRPCDANETAYCWELALKRKDGPVALILSRQKLKTLDRTKYTKENMAKYGAYVLSGAPNQEFTIIASGSEVGLALALQDKLAENGIQSSVVSAPCLELFEMQDEAYKNEVIPKNTKHIVIEAAKGDIWYKYVNKDALVISMETFGKSGKGPEVMKHFGFDEEYIYQKVKEKWM